MTLRNQNGDNLDRSACLVTGAGESAAAQCGDLLVTHSLPGFSTMNKERALTLVYNSAQAAPEPLVAVGVTQNSATVVPTSVFLRLTVNGWRGIRRTTPAGTPRH